MQEVYIDGVLVMGSFAFNTGGGGSPIPENLKGAVWCNILFPIEKPKQEVVAPHALFKPLAMALIHQDKHLWTSP